MIRLYHLLRHSRTFDAHVLRCTLRSKVRLFLVSQVIELLFLDFGFYFIIEI